MLLSCCGAPIEQANTECTVNEFIGRWSDSGGRGGQVTVTRDDIAIRTGEAVTRLRLESSRDVAARNPADVLAEMAPAAELYPAEIYSISRAAMTVCTISVATPGGRIAFVRDGDEVLWMDVARSDPPTVQRLRRVTSDTDAVPAVDYEAPPK